MKNLDFFFRQKRKNTPVQCVAENSLTKVICELMNASIEEKVKRLILAHFVDQFFQGNTNS